MSFDPDQLQLLVDPCQQWINAGGRDDVFFSGRDIIADSELNIDDCRELIQRVRGGGIGATVASSYDAIRVPNLLKSETLWVVVLSVIVPLLVIGVYTDWSYKWPSERNQKPKPK